MSSKLRRATTYRALIATAVATAMLLGDQQSGLAAAAAARPDPKFNQTEWKSIDGRTAKAAPRPADPSAGRVLRGAPTITWPSPATAEVAVPVPGGATTWGLALNGGRVAQRAKAGNLPVWVAPTAAAAKERLATGVTASLPAKVKVDLVGRTGDALELKVSRADGVAKTGQVTLGVDYRAFRDTYGGDWATRLRFTTRTAAGTKVIPTRNNGSGEVIAELPVGAQPQTFLVAAGAGSGAGDYGKADQSGGSATWNVGGSSGDFSWSLPFTVPPSIGGPAPTVGLEYSSGALDGFSSATNNQTSLLGQGFSLSGGGSIERRFRSCAKDKSGNNGDKNTGDMCFAGDSLNISVAGKSGSLVLDHKDANGEVWRMRGDDGSVVERLTGAVNGDDGVLAADKGEYWRMTSPDGTKFYFGLNRLPGWSSGKDETKSAWTMPVFGNNAGEQCNKPAFVDSWCQQAYQWNLDYVVDRSGNTMSLFYDTETGNYSRFVTKTTVSPYVRAGNLKRIEYGQADGSVFTQKPVAQVLFTTAERCTPEPCGAAQPSTYPDTPWDLNCASTTNCDNHYTPTFWTQRRLAKVTTQVWRAASSKHEDVQSWSFRQEYLRGDNSSPALWLREVTPTGLVGPNPQQMQSTSFDGVAMGNRVDSGSDMVPPLEWFRINAIHSGSGGDVSVVYDSIDCTPSSLPAADHNDRRCRPQKWTPEGSAAREDWYHKYVVKQVSETDRTVAASDPWQAPVPTVTTVAYQDKPAWRFSEQDAGTDLSESTWSQWRGYGDVKVTKGGGDESQSVTETLYYRGMDEDRNKTGPVKDVKIKDSTGAEVDDTNEFSGQPREQTTFNGAAVLHRNISDYYLGAPTASMTQPWGTLTARPSGQKKVAQYLPTDTGTLRLGTENTYDTSGRLISKDEANDVNTTADDTCTRFTYVENPSSNLRQVPARQQLVSKNCGTTFANSDVIRDDQMYYDGATSISTPPTKGLLTRAERLSGFDSAGKPTYELAFTMEYDAVGRQIRKTDALNRSVRKIYNPGYGPITKITEVAANGLESVTDYEPAFGVPVGMTTPDGRRADKELDAFGRITKTWSPGHPRSGPADIETEYAVRDDGPSVTTTKRLVKPGVYDTSYELYDGLQRLRQTQEKTPNGGWLVTDHRYDSRGHEVKLNGPYFTRVLAEKELKLVDENTLPKQQVTVWDEADRPKQQLFKSLGQTKWTIEHDVANGRQSIDPPDGQAPTTRITDAQGRLVELRQYQANSPTGPSDKTTYTYWPSGQLKTTTDPAGNVWSYKYDLQGRKVQENDPDKGITKFTYDATDQITSTLDANGVKLFVEYDNAGRRIAIHNGAPDGPRLSSWTYDTVAPGRPASSTKYVVKDGRTDEYTTTIVGYSPSGEPTGTSITLPASEGKLAGTYTIGQTYNDDGKIATRTLPKVGDPDAGGMAAETLTYGYNDQGLVKSLAGQDTYVRQMSYTPFEDADVLTLGTASGPFVQQKFEYDSVTRRVNRVVVDKELSPTRVSDTQYQYDPAGNITKSTDIAPAASGEATDTQCFNYDYLRRLTKAWTPKPGEDNEAGDCTAAPSVAALGGPAPYWQQWTFDKTGNRKSEQTISAAGTTTSTYDYGSAKPHALTAVATTGPTGAVSSKTFGYDATGNLNKRTTGGVDEILNWDPEGHLADTAKGDVKTSAVYDTEGNRIIRRDSSGTTLYVGETEIHLDKSGSTVSGTRYYSFGDRAVAVRTSGKLTWLIGDLHGTPTTTIDSVTQNVQRRRMTPYGVARGAAPVSWPGQRDFHGGTNDPDTGLVHLGAREYDKSTGRFISVDPIVDNTDPQQMNGYAYANNNPVTYDDSDGKLVFVIIAFVFAIVFVVMEIAMAIQQLFGENVTIIDTKPVEDAFWDLLHFMWQNVVRWVTTRINFIRWVWRMIEVLVSIVVGKLEVHARTIVQNIPDKVAPRPVDPKKDPPKPGPPNQPPKPGPGNNPPKPVPPQKPGPRVPKPKPKTDDDKDDGKLYRGADVNKKTGVVSPPDWKLKSYDYDLDADGNVMEGQGPSTNTNANEIRSWGRVPYEVIVSTVPPQLQITWTSKTHYEVMVAPGQKLTLDEFKRQLNKIQFGPPATR
ncbi:hypothetical protein OG474_11110 [Kribbella sp. NBC_01505]|uniref:RHS repeat domain-containing protein n=1 Tax=Kribbella sp. NBC_01505 TaxID=2903580 RepID=UPI00386DB07D